ncbi:hypothetical protein [Nonomuraea diastatica]|uniref:hypothetical protein n=1 Tax=Nonomuraea diastatica TaxID=1848329 RepID=UPI001FE2653B|nr:hypothetical protein [Nonomuraea diastatica]
MRVSPAAWAACPIGKQLLEQPELTVADACPTPLTLASAWGRATGTPAITAHTHAPRLEGITTSST